MFKIKTNRKTDKAFKLIDDLAKRLKAVRERVPWLVANDVHDQVVANIPQKDEWKDYREGLEVVRVGSSHKDPAFAVQLSNFEKGRVKKIDAPVTVLYVKAHRRLSKIPPAIQVLIKYSPWTTATIPFMPSQRDAVLQTRRVSKQWAMRVASRRRNDRPFWSREMAKAGRREVKKNQPTFSPKAQPLPDYAYQALKLEFGLGMKSTPHWRPALRPYFKDPGRAILAKDPKLRDILDPNFHGWKSWRSTVKNTISRVAAMKFVPFQQKLGL